MNKRGNIFFGIVIALFIFASGVLFMPFIEDDITTYRNDMSCSQADSISDGAKLSCLMTDGLMPYFIWFFISLALGILGGRR